MDVALIALGAVLVTYGWYWGGVTEARTTAYALGGFAFMLAAWFAFSGGYGGEVVGGGFIGFGAVFSFLAASNAWNESAQDRTYGMFALLFGIAAFFGYIALTSDYFVEGGMDGQYSLGALVLGVVLVLHFISAGLVASNRGFKNLVGWVTLIAGVALLYFGFANALDAGINPL